MNLLRRDTQISYVSSPLLMFTGILEPLPSQRVVTQGLYSPSINSVNSSSIGFSFCKHNDALELIMPQLPQGPQHSQQAMPRCESQQRCASVSKTDWRGGSGGCQGLFQPSSPSARHPAPPKKTHPEAGLQQDPPPRWQHSWCHSAHTRSWAFAPLAQGLLDLKILQSD